MVRITFAVMFTSFSFCCAVQVFSRGAHGKLVWRTAPWRDRSAVPTPPAEIIQVNKKRVGVMRPNTRRHDAQVSFPVSEKQAVAIKTTRNMRDKKNKIHRIFFSLPIGGQLPVFYSSKSTVHKKSNVIRQGKGQPFLKNAMEQSINVYRNAGGLTDIKLASRTIRRKRPETEDAVSRGLGARTSMEGMDTEVAPYDDTIGTKPLQKSTALVSVHRRLRSIDERKIPGKDQDPANSRLPSGAKTNAADDAKKSGLPEGSKQEVTRPSRNKINKEMEDIITKFMVVL